MKIKIKIDPPMMNPGATWDETTFYVSRDKNFNTIDLTSNKKRIDGDVLDTLVVQIDADISRIYVKNTIKLSDSPVSIPSSPIVIDENGKSIHTYDALLITPTVTKDAMFDFNNDVELSSTEMTHMKRSPIVINTGWYIYDTDSIPFFEDVRKGPVNEIVINKSVCTGRESKLLTAAVVQSDAHNSSNRGEVILNDVDENYKISLLGKLFDRGPSLLYVKSNMIISSRFSYKLLLNGEEIDEGMDSSGHIHIRKQITITPDTDYVISITIDVTSHSSVIRNIPIRSVSNNTVNILDGMMLADVGNIDSHLNHIPFNTSLYSASTLANGYIPMVDSNSILLCKPIVKHNLDKQFTIRPTNYMSLGGVIIDSSVQLYRFLVTGSNRMLFVGITNDNKAYYRYDLMAYGNVDTGVNTNVNISIPDPLDLTDIDNYIPNACIESSDTILSAFVDDGTVNILRLSINPDYVVDVADRLIPLPASIIAGNAQMHNINNSMIALIGDNDLADKTIVEIYTRDMTTLIHTDTLDFISTGYATFIPTVNNVESPYGASGLFMIQNASGNATLIEYPITGTSINTDTTGNGKLSIVNDGDKILILEI
jgi:hypothetical protein